MFSKAIMRRYIKERHLQYSPLERQAYSEKMMAHLEKHPRFQAAKIVLLFHSLPDEPSTHRFIDKWCDKKNIYLPVCEGKNLRLRLYKGPEYLKEGAFRIMEPQGQNLVAYDDIDLAIIPGMAFDVDKHRLGRGKGFYDRLLAHPAFACVYKIGLAFPYQLFETIPHSTHDILMDEIFQVNFFSVQNETYI